MTTNHAAVSCVSVIIPLYNKRETVGRAIRSVLRQQEVEKEIIIVDDGSTDNPFELVTAFGSTVHYRRQERAGPSAARNLGAGLSRHDLLVFLDADDELLDGCLAAHVRCRREYPDTKLSLASFRVVDGTKVLREEDLGRRIADPENTGEVARTEHFHSSLVTNIACAAICVSRDLFDVVGGFDPELRCWEVTDLVLRLMLASPVVCVLRSCLVGVHENKSHSHFARMHNDPRYLARFAHKLLDGLERVPATEQPYLRRRVASILNQLATRDTLGDFRSLLRRAHGMGQLPAEARRLRLLAWLPRPLVNFYFCCRLGVAQLSGGR
jgi:glycosyltransferase involved in cell wall biosynthesis